MSIRLTGQLLSPTDGSPAANGQIRFISLQGTGKVPKGAIAIEAADANGDYDFTLEFGRFSVEIRQADKFVKQGAVSVNADTPTPLEIGELLEYTEPLTPGQIIYVEQLTAQAEAAAQSANVSQSAANSSAMAASNSAAEAKSEADRASEITGLDTVEEAIDLTLAKTLGLMTETEVMAQADVYEQMFAASGMVHMGKYRDKGNDYGIPVSEGIWCYLESPASNQLFLGGVTGGDRVTGSSETDYPVTYIAGAIANVLHRDTTTITQATTNFIFPQAEAGTRVYDSTGDVRGSGEATLDFRYDNDPKYGNAPSGTEAEILREAISRAFEGSLLNGDFRLGNANGWVTYGTGNIAVNDSVATMTGTFVYQVVGLEDLPVGTECEVQLDVGEATDSTSWNLQVNFGGGLPIVDLLRNVDAGVHTVKFTVPAGASTNQFEFHARNNSLVINSVSVRKVTEEVVTHRSDVATWESYDEELTGRKEIMECIQSLSSTFGDTDVPTVLSTRPLSYFQQYDGQFADPDIQNDRYRCVVWDDLTDEQKRKVAAYMGNKLYVGDNGNLVNRRLRARTFRGLGNGDWDNIDVTNIGGSWDQFLSFARDKGAVQPQGVKDKVTPYTVHSGQTYATTELQERYNDKAYKGAFSLWSADKSYGYKGRCFLYVVTSVPRANQGAYYKGLNEFGCRTWVQSGQGWNAKWSDVTGIKTQQQCFIVKSSGDDITDAGAADISGYIGSTQGSGHPDGIFYDGITAGGLNGVIDWRLPAVANDSPEEQAKVQGKVENKTFRGLEKLISTKVFTGLVDVFDASQYTTRRLSMIAGDITQQAKDWVGTNWGYDTPDDNGTLPAIGYLVNENTKAIYPIHSVNISSSGSEFRFNTSLDGYNEAYADDGVPWSLVLYSELQTNLSVSGEFNTQLVVGNPAYIKSLEALKDGWLGHWFPQIMQPSIPLDVELTRKRMETGSSQGFLYTAYDNENWQALSGVFNNTTNSMQLGGSANSPSNVYIIEYTAYAKVTEPCENKPVYNGKKGLMPAIASSSHNVLYSALLGESLIGKVLKSSGSKTFDNVDLTHLRLNPDGGGTINPNVDNFTSHSPIDLAAPVNNSPAFKALPYQIAENEQCFIGYQANELVYDTGAAVNIDAPTIAQNTWPVGTYIRLQNGLFNGWYIVTSLFGSGTWEGYQINGSIAVGANGDLYYGDQRIAKRVGHSGAGWGDDDKIKVTADGSDTFVDLNGNTNLSVSHKTTMPTGWTKNRARIGEQVEGVDL